MFKLSLVMQICLICGLAVLYCHAEVTSTNNAMNIEDKTVHSSPLVGQVDLVYCLFDTSSISVTESSVTQQQKYHEEFEKGRYVESFTRHRTLGYLRYFLRGVSTNMPWIRNLIVVMPEYDRVSSIIANNPAVTVIRHRDFIPKEYIPVFNEQTVLQFLHLIPNISREFIYMNQHMYPIAPLTPQHFKSVPHGLTLVPIRVQRDRPTLEAHELSAINNALSLVVHGPGSSEQVTGLDYDHFAPMLFDTHVIRRMHEYYQQHMTDSAYNKFPSPSDISFQHLYVHYIIKKDVRNSQSREHDLIPSATVHVSNWTQISLAKLKSNNITVLHVSHELLRGPWRTQENDVLADMMGSLYNQVQSPYEADMQHIAVRGLFLGLALIGLFLSCTLGVTFHFDLWRSPRRAHATKIA